MAIGSRMKAGVQAIAFETETILWGDGVQAWKENVTIILDQATRPCGQRARVAIRGELRFLKLIAWWLSALQVGHTMRNRNHRV